MAYKIFQTDCMEWLKVQPDSSIDAVCTDPPYGLVEFSRQELVKMRSGQGGIWRIPPRIGGSERSPLPRFSILTRDQLDNIKNYFSSWGRQIHRVVKPGAHILIASNSTVSPYVQIGMSESGFEIRGTIIRCYWTFRGGDRPKLAECDYPEVSVTPRGAYEPWLLFRKPLSEKTVSANLARWGTGGLRRPSQDVPFSDLIESEKTPRIEEDIADHPCLKPQKFMRQIVRALLPVAKGVILDPFMGSGSTIAASEAVGYDSIGLEIDDEYYEMAHKAIPSLARLNVNFSAVAEKTESPGQCLFSDF